MNKIAKITGMGLVVLTCMALSSVSAFANCSKGSKHKNYEHMDLQQKFMFKSGMILHAKSEAGLTDEQVSQVKQLKLDVQKELIRQKAEIELLKLDIWNEIYQPQPDVAKINQLIDQKYEHKKAKSKALAEAFVKLKQIPSEEQWMSIKGAKKGGDSSCGCGSYHKG